STTPAFALADEQLDAYSPVIDCFEYQSDNNYSATPLPYFGEMQAVIDDEANAPSSEGDVPGSSYSTHNGSADNTEGNNTGQDGAPNNSNADASNTGQTGTSNGMGASQDNARLDGTPSSAGANNGGTAQNTIPSSSNAKKDSASNSSDAGQNNASGAGSSNGTTQGNIEGGVSADQGNDTQGDAANGADENQGVASGSDGADQNGATSGASADQNSSPDGAGSKADEQESNGGSADESTSDTDKPGTGTDASQGETTDRGDNPQPGTPEPDTPGAGADASQGGTVDKGNGSQTEKTETPSPDKPGSDSSTQEPAMLTGWQNIGGYRYYYDNDGKPLTGLQTIEDKTYLFNDKGQLGYGFLYLGNNVVSYFDPITGSQLTGKQFIHGSWRNIDEQTGLNCGLTEVLESGKTNTYYYDNYDGGLHTGQQYVNNSWHFFDEDTGRMYTRDEEVRRIVQFALAELGGSESTAFGYLKEVKADGGTYCGYGPCMATVRHIFKAAGMSGFLADGFVDSWPHKYLDLMIEKGQHTMTPRVGMVAFFLWENSFANQIGVSADHAEIIVEVGDGWYKTVGAIAGGIKESIYYTAADYNIGFGVPAFYR
ncbi:MAG: hypothetical protein SPK07_11595, partial [Coriobacteriales bacterium]|nr:hypothetical protein [Coriobacteriales bacterium]